MVFGTIFQYSYVDCNDITIFVALFLAKCPCPSCPVFLVRHFLNLCTVAHHI